ncbi:unnamed protein product [Adineta ricciae]|uniref:Uncharacterized protein n=1 Tax=Adineta ricciae TaxID=249248 RepID=A0A814E190_ADIRI|nr:unnamed protein product [Adineta ricciae]CAF0961076.1 unnamed protein product [Adineta ricciae]
MECEYSSREYQVVLRPDIFDNSFESGVLRVLDELIKIGNTKLIPFEISQSSLKLKNQTLVPYTLDASRQSNDFFIPVIFKSRRKKPTHPADIVMKISNADPALTCIPLTISDNYKNNTKAKFELDLYAEGGRLTARSAYSFTVDLSMNFNQTSAINMSDILTDAAAKFTYSKQPLIIVPVSATKITMQTAEFNIKLVGQKIGATMQFYRKPNGIKAEFSFRVKGLTVEREVLLAAQNLVLQLSQKSTIALYAINQPSN